MYKHLLRPFLFSFSAEKAHHLTFALLKLAHFIPLVPFVIRKIYQFNDPRLERKVFGLTFKNPVGLAAGLDKDAKYIDELDSLGFGFIEIGTLTPKAQPGNDKPRLFRLISDEAIINRMGFNNEGVEAAIEHLKKRRSTLIIGGNIGKNKVTPNEQAEDDYVKSFEALFDYVDYFVVNVSSPNTPNLRALQEKEPLKNLLSKLKNLNSRKENPKPILLKIAPDLGKEQLDDIVEIVKETGIDGVIATNTTISREGLKANASQLESIGMGGLSGKPLQRKSTEVIKYIVDKSSGSIPVIAVGGIHTPEAALEKLKAGAVLVQLYTGFIYEGPVLIKRINKAILSGLK